MGIDWGRRGRTCVVTMRRVHAGCQSGSNQECARWLRSTRAPMFGEPSHPAADFVTDLRDQLQATLGDAYTIERELGGGGMARVFLAEETALGRKVVVKVLPPDLSAEISAERFRREARVAAGLQHPNVVPLLSTGGAAGLLYYTMPFVEGESLRERLVRERQLPVSEALRLTGEVADALACAHARGIVHRDVKPENVLLSGGHAMLTDFGIAKAVAQSRGETLTATGLSLGTPLYMAPEQASGERDVDGRADVYALGCVLYEMLAGEPPFGGPTAQAVVAKHLSAPFPQVRHSRPDVPPRIDDVLARATAKAPADRYATAAAFRSGLSESVVLSEWRRFASLRTTGVVVAASALVAWFAVSRLRPRAPSGVQSVAVLPFENTTHDSTQEYFSDGMTDEVSSALASASSIRVAARTSSYSFKGRHATPQEVGKRLGVATVVQGSVSRLGDRLHVTAELVGAQDGLSLWSQSFDRETKDVYAVQHEITAAIVGALRAQLRGGAPAVRRHETANLAAHDLYLRGLYLGNTLNRESMFKALDYFHQALALDSTYALAWAGIAQTSGDLADSYIVPDSAYPQAEAAAKRALSLDTTLAEPYAAAAFIEAAYRWKLADAKRDLDRAQVLNPSNAEAHVAESYYWLGMR